MTLERSSKQEAYEFVEKRRKELAPERRDADGEQEERDQPGDWIPYMRYPDQSDSGGRRAFGSDDSINRQNPARSGPRYQSKTARRDSNDQDETSEASSRGRFNKEEIEPEIPASSVPPPPPSDSRRGGAKPFKRDEVDQRPASSRPIVAQGDQMSHQEDEFLRSIIDRSNAISDFIRRLLRDGKTMGGDYFKIVTYLNRTAFMGVKFEPRMKLEYDGPFQSDDVKRAFKDLNINITNAREAVMDYQKKLENPSLGDRERGNFEDSYQFNSLSLRKLQQILFELIQSQMNAMSGNESSAGPAAKSHGASSSVPEDDADPHQRIASLKKRVTDLIGERDKLGVRMAELYTKIYEVRPGQENFWPTIDLFDQHEALISVVEKALMQSFTALVLATRSDKISTARLKAIGVMDARLQAFKDYLEDRIQMCRRMHIDEKNRLSSVLTRLQHDTTFLNEQKAIPVDIDSKSTFSLEADWKAQRLHMLLDSPSLYKAWLLASTPEEGCSSGT